MEQREAKRKPAIGYVGTFKNKKTGETEKKVTVTIDLAVIGEAIGRDLGLGEVKLIGFKNSYKKLDKHPDLNFVIHQAKEEATTNASSSEFDL